MWRAADSDEAAAREIAQALVRGDLQSVVSRFDPALRAVLSEAQLRAGWNQVMALAGAFRELGAARAETSRGATVLVLPMTFEKATWELKAALGADRQVTGLFFSPVSTTWSPPPYAPARLAETAVEVGEEQLPGTLALPEGEGVFPAAVLVHGSGPNDADETLGPNKPFRDLALGLAARGIATLRYDKRTHAQRAAAMPIGGFTVKEEVLDDAIAAVHLAASTQAIDGERVWVIGHSLGGLLAPRIAAASSEVAGIVILAGPTRTIEDLLVDQMRTIAGAGSPEVALAEAVARAVRDPQLTDDASIDFLGVKMPGSYFLDLRRYDAPATAASLAVPILVLQGERDYQVRRADYDGWAKALAGRPRARLKLYPALNHLFEAGQGPSLPPEYLRPDLHVDAEVIADIAAFMLARDER
jgi:dienelactone hydrolase